MSLGCISVLRQKALASLTPPPILDLADWVEANVYLSGDVSATPGRVKLWSYRRGIASAISDPEIERVTVQKSVRVGYSMLLTAAMASFVANEPSPILMLLPQHPAFAAVPGRFAEDRGGARPEESAAAQRPDPRHRRGRRDGDRRGRRPDHPRGEANAFLQQSQDPARLDADFRGNLSGLPVLC